jgi:anti-anti-sigma regulatory factor
MRRDRRHRRRPAAGGSAEFCGTSGIGALVNGHKRAQAGRGEVLPVLNTAAVRRIFTLTRLDQVIPYFRSLEDALEAAR